MKYGYAGNECDALEKLQYEFWYLRHQSLAHRRADHRPHDPVGARRRGRRAVTALPLVTVLIPARNEAGRHRAAAWRRRGPGPPVDRLEVHRRRRRRPTTAPSSSAAGRCGGYGFASTAVLDNPGGTTPSNLNVGLGRAPRRASCAGSTPAP